MLYGRRKWCEYLWSVLPFLDPQVNANNSLSVKSMISPLAILAWQKRNGSNDCFQCWGFTTVGMNFFPERQIRRKGMRWKNRYIRAFPFRRWRNRYRREKWRWSFFQPILRFIPIPFYSKPDSAIILWKWIIKTCKKHKTIDSIVHRSIVCTKLNF